MELQHLIWRGGGRRLRIVMAVVLLTVVAPLARHSAADSGQTAAQVADEIVSVQATADQAAGEWSQREADAQRLAKETAAAQEAVNGAKTVVQETEANVSALAIDRYTSVVEPAVLPFADSGTVRLERQTLSTFASDTSLDDLDRFQAAQTDLEHKQHVLNDTSRENDAALASLTKTRQDLDAKLQHLQQLQTKLRDAEVKRAYEAKLAALRAEQVAKAEADAQAAATLQTKAAPPPARGEAPAPSTPPTTRDETRPTSPASPTSPATPATAPTPTADVTATPSTPAGAQAQAPAPAPAPAPVEPSLPAPRSGPAINGLICPVSGPNSFGDSWGAPRSGGKTHEGVDMMSPQGTPLVAAIDGFANMHTNRLGGNTVGLRASDGNYYYYAHLSAWEGPSRNVRQGEVIGYVGHTGETSADHLHFGIYVGGGTGPAINPYPIVRQIC